MQAPSRRTTGIVGGDQIPPQPFFQTPDQRTALARRRFFEEGVRPSGLVSEPVIQSWMRCVSQRRSAREHLAFDPVTTSRMSATIERNQALLAAARQDLHDLEASLAGTDCRVLLTDAQGIIVHATHNPNAAQQPILCRISRVGVDIAESVVCTTAPGITANTGKVVTVTGAEHFNECLAHVDCAAAPIRDARGNIAAVLDLSIESRHFGFDAACVVAVYATSIENRLLQAHSHDELVLRFQAAPTMIDTPMQALAGVGSDGTVAWMNAMAARLLGLPEGDTTPQSCEALFGTNVATLLAWRHDARVRQIALPNGLSVWLAVGLQTQAEAAPLRPTLGDHSRRLVETTLRDCGGNIAQAARMLGVSRGMIYRKLKN